MKTIKCSVCHKEMNVAKWLVDDMSEDVFVCDVCKDIEPLCETCIERSNKKEINI